MVHVVNGSEPMLRLIGDLPTGTPVAFEATFGWGWLVQQSDHRVVPQRPARSNRLRERPCLAPEQR
jgi:hypothetical protein